MIHDPVSADGQGNYTGTQYRSAIFCHDEEQMRDAFASRDRLAAKSGSPVVTEIVPASAFWPAEKCHQQFYKKCSAGFCTSRQLDE